MCLRGGFVTIAAFLAAPAIASEPTSRLLRDFMVQDVCAGDDGKAVMRLSPLDRACGRRRDLAVGERLPYHKHDHGPRFRPTAGYQRSDSYPAWSASLGPVVVQSFDFGTAQRRFGRFDERYGDGGQLVAFSERGASIAATEDGAGGLQFFVGAGCRGRPAPPALRNAWIIAVGDLHRPAETIARLRLVREAETCPERLDEALTRWQIAARVYRNAAAPARSLSLATLVSEHFGGRDIAAAKHLERFYFTRELGFTRWERWEQLGRTRIDDASRRAQSLANSGRCDPADAPHATANWAMIDCREWTNIVPPDDPGGDPPGFWLDRLATHPVASKLLGVIETRPRQP